jgi:hypothetical protein
LESIFTSPVEACRGATGISEAPAALSELILSTTFGTMRAPQLFDPVLNFAGERRQTYAIDHAA